MQANSRGGGRLRDEPKECLCTYEARLLNAHDNYHVSQAETKQTPGMP